jgi:hypothetical protein
LISDQGHETWEVLLAGQGQLRLAPSGHVIGIDMEPLWVTTGGRLCQFRLLLSDPEAVAQGRA